MKQRVVRAVVFFVVLLGAWHLLVATGVWSEVFLPSPVAVGGYLVRGTLDGSILSSFEVTVWRLFAGYSIGVLVGLPVGFLVARSHLCADTIGVVALGMQTLPSVCWVPLALVWFGQNETAVLFVVVMGTVWSILLATRDGIRSVPPIYVRAAQTMGSSPTRTLTHVVFPAALPHLVGGMKQGWAFAWRSLMAAEMYIAIITGFGLGHLLHHGRELMAMDQVLGVMLLVVLLGLMVDRVVFAPTENFLHRRWGTGM